MAPEVFTPFRCRARYVGAYMKMLPPLKWELCWNPLGLQTQHCHLRVIYIMGAWWKTNYPHPVPMTRAAQATEGHGWCSDCRVLSGYRYHFQVKGNGPIYVWPNTACRSLQLNGWSAKILLEFIWYFHSSFHVTHLRWELYIGVSYRVQCLIHISINSLIQPSKTAIFKLDYMA